MYNNLNKHPSVVNVDKIKEICRPIFNSLSVNAFSYSRIYRDGSRTELWTDIDAMLHCFFTKKYICDAGAFNYLKDLKYAIFLDELDKFPSRLKKSRVSQVMDLRDSFNHDYCFFLIRNQGQYLEFFIFYLPVYTQGGYNKFINNLDKLQSFADYFVERAGDIIHLADENRLISPKMISGSVIQSNSKNKPITTFTKKEKYIAYLLLEGKNMREIAELLCRSPRTVEGHVANLKDKLHCNKRSELISKLAECL